MGDSTSIGGVYVDIVLDRERKLYLGMRGLQYLANKYGSVKAALGKMSDAELLQSLSKEGLELIFDLLYACLVHEDRGIKIEDIVDNFPLNRMAEILTAVAGAITGNLPKPTDPQTP